MSVCPLKEGCRRKLGSVYTVVSNVSRRGKVSLPKIEFEMSLEGHSQNIEKL